MIDCISIIVQLQNVKVSINVDLLLVYHMDYFG